MTGSHAPDEDAGLLPKAITYDGGPTWRMLLPHIDALANHAPPSAGTETTAFLLNQAGVFPGDHGQVGPERVSRHVQETLAARSNLAVTYEAAGRPGPGHPPYARLMTCANT
jgi:hypothetical protein